MGNLRLIRSNHLKIDIPTNCVSAVIGIQKDSSNTDAKAKSLVFYDAGFGFCIDRMVDTAASICTKITSTEKQMPRPWVRLKTPEGDDLALVSGSIVSMIAVDPENEKHIGANTIVYFTVSQNPNDGQKFVFVAETMDEIDEFREKAVKAAVPTPPEDVQQDLAKVDGAAPVTAPRKRTRKPRTA